MNRSLILTVAFAFLAFQMGFSQSLIENQTVILHEKGAQEILDQYHSFEGAVLNMSRNEWSVVRDWDGYDEDKARAILHEAKESWKKENEALTLDRKQMRQNQPGGWDCWIEPDDSYEQITTFDWEYT